MKGFTRKLDDLGRVCIPKILRKNYNITDEVEFITTQEGVLIRAVKEQSEERDFNVILADIDLEMQKVKYSNPSVYEGLIIAKRAITGDL